MITRILLCSFVAGIVCGSLRSEPLSYPASAIPGKWELNTSRLKCEIRQTIPGYGEAILQQRNTRPHYFYVKSWSGVAKSGLADLYSKAPVWKRHSGRKHLATVKLNPGRLAIQLNASLTQTLLNELQLGKLTRFRYRDETGQAIKIDISSIYFRSAYEQFVACTGKLLPFTFRDVVKTNVQFDLNSILLNTHTKRKLLRIRDYVLADPGIKVVQIDGYTDNQGRRAHNVFLSEKRAKIVEKFLLDHGVPKSKFSLNWHGNRHLLVDDEKKLAQERNRRVTVQLFTQKMR